MILYNFHNVPPVYPALSFYRKAARIDLCIYTVKYVKIANAASNASPVASIALPGLDSFADDEDLRDNSGKLFF